jgi:large subunit ribosomal protein L9
MAATPCCCQGRATRRRRRECGALRGAAPRLEKLAGEQLGGAQERAAALREFRLAITAKAGWEGKLFGSVGTSDIAEACTAAGQRVNRSEVRLPTGPIRAVGEHQVTLHLHTDVEVTITVIIVAEEQG